jgi:hypothetical protein
VVIGGSLTESEAVSLWSKSLTSYQCRG